MKTRTPVTLWLILLSALFAGPVAPQAQSADEILIKQAIDLEKAKGDVKGAIEIYKKLAASRDPKTAAAGRDGLERLQQPTGRVTTAKPESFPSEILTREGAPDGLTLRRTLPGGDQVAVRQSGSDQRRRFSLVFVDGRTGKERELAPLSAMPRGFDVEPSPNGAFLAVIVGEQLVIVNTREPASPTVLPLGLGNPSQSYRFRPLLQWSPDSHWLPFVAAGEKGLLEFNLLQAATRQVRSLKLQGDGPPDFRWSPSGAELALHLTLSSPQTDEIAVVTLATGATRRIPVPVVPASTGARTRLAAWTTKAGLLILATPTTVAATDYWLVNMEDGRARKICSGGSVTLISARNDVSLRGGTGDGCLSVSRDGLLQLVWLHQSRRLVLRDTASGRDRSLTQGSAEEHAGYLSPDDRVAVFTSNREGFWGLYAVLVDQAPTSKPALLLRMDGQPAGILIDWAPDGMHAGLSYDEFNIHRVAMDKATGRSSGDLERLTQNAPYNRTPSFSEDGRRIAYWSNRIRFGLSVMDADGANERQITEQPFVWHPAPMWASDSEILTEAFHLERSPSFAHQMVHSHTGAARDVTVPRAVFPEALDGVAGLAWIPARRELGYIDRGPDSAGQQIRARSLANGGERALATFPDGGVHAFAVSSTGSQIAYSRFTQDGKCPCELGVLNTETGQRKVLETLPNPQVPAAWSPDGRFFLYGAARPRVMDSVAAKSWTLMDPAAQPTWVQEGSWSPDGTAIVLTVRSNRSETRRWKDLGPTTIARAIQAGGGR